MDTVRLLLLLSLFVIVVSSALCANLSICNNPNICCCQGYLIVQCVCCDSTVSSCSNGECILLSPTPTPSNSKTPTSTPTSSNTPSNTQTPTPSLSLGASSSVTPTVSQSTTSTSSLSSTSTITQTPTRTPSRTESTTNTLPAIKMNQSPSATPIPSISNSVAPIGCYSHPIFQTIDCLNATEITNEQLLIVKPLNYKVNFILPIVNPILVKGTLELTPEGEINLLYPYSFLCTDYDLILNGTIAINIDRKLKYNKNITLINCVNSHNHSIIIGSEFKLKPIFLNNKPKCSDYQIKLLNTSLENNTLLVSIDKQYVHGCLETKYIVIIPVSILVILACCLIVMVIIIASVIIISLCIKLHLYRKTIKYSNNFIDHLYNYVFMHEGEPGIRDIYAEE